MKLRHPLKLLLVFGSLFFCQLSQALSLGALSITSAAEKNLEARIVILMSAQEVQAMGNLQAQVAEPSSFEKFGITKLSEDSTPSIKIQKDAAGKPVAILLSFSKTARELEKAFNDMVIELSWSSGKLTRVYTVLNIQSKEVQVKAGDNLISLTQQIAPQLAGAEFNQVLVALYRLNPKAFYAGSIHRLKEGALITVPTPAMAASIPVQEAREFFAGGVKDFRERQLDRSTDSNLRANNRTYAQAQLRDDFKDRLKIGSSLSDTDQAIAQTKLNEEVIAQQKMLEEAQQRISELERNISDLKAIQARKFWALADISNEQYGILLGILALAGIFLYSVTRRSKPSARSPAVKEPLPEGTEGKPQTPASLVAPSLQDRPVSPEMRDEPEPVFSPAAAAIVAQDLPPHVQELFSKIDLNLPQVQVPLSELQPSAQVVNPAVAQVVDSEIASGKPAAVQNSGYTLDLNVNQQPISSSVEVAKPPLNNDEQKVRLNLARSYIKIKDFETARILLADLTELGSNADEQVLAQAQELLREIS